MEQMTKKLVVLFPYVFTKFDYYKYEIDKLYQTKGIDLEVHDLSSILNERKFNQAWKIRRKVFKKHKNFNNLFEWYKYLKKNKNHIVIYSFISLTNFRSFLIHIAIWKIKCSLLIQSSEDVATYKDKNNLFMQILEKKPNLNQILFHTKRNIVTFLINFFKFNEIVNLCIKKRNRTFNSFSNKNVQIISDDVSKCLGDHKNKKKTEKLAVYLDTPDPYFEDDYMESGKKKNISSEETQEYYSQLKNLFIKLKIKYGLKTIVIPHPKNKGVRNPYFNGYLYDHAVNAAQKNIKKSKLVISKGSTAIAYGIFYKKPVILIYSNLLKDYRLKYDLYFQSKVTGSRVVDLSKNINKYLNNLFSINKKKYQNYKIKYMTGKLDKKIEPNYIVLRRLIKTL